MLSAGRLSTAMVLSALAVAGCSGGDRAGSAAGPSPTAATNTGSDARGAPASTPPAFLLPTRSGPPTAPATPPSTSPPAVTAPTSPAAHPERTNPGGLTDAHLVGQLFTPYVYGSGAVTASFAQRAANIALYGEPTPAAVVRRWHLGGIILLDRNTLDPERADLSTGNVNTASQLRALTGGLQAAALGDSHIRLLVGTDQEGGRVQRIRNGVTQLPAQARLASLGDHALYCTYRKLGAELLALGVNQDYAPDADVLRAAGGVIGDRSYGPDPARVAADAQIAATALRDAGVLPTLKHWPGHGSTATDSHARLAVITESASSWQAIDRPPFARAASTAGAVMTGHLALPAVDPSGSPATLSPVLINGLLRRGLHYTGLVVTDSLWMAPIQAAGDPGDVALRALAAGDDMQLMPVDLPRAYLAVLHSLRTSPTVRRQVQDAVRRILTAKQQLTPRADRSC